MAKGGSQKQGYSSKGGGRLGMLQVSLCHYAQEVPIEEVCLDK